MKNLSLLLVMLFLFVGCVPQSTIIPNTPQNYQAEYNKVWNAAVDSIDELGFTAAQLNKEEGYITTSKEETTQVYGQMTGPELLLLMIPKERVKITIRLTKEGESIRVNVVSFIERFNSQSILPNKWSQVESNGTLEKEIQEKIKAKLIL